MLADAYKKASVMKTGEYLTTINEMTDQIPALRPQLLWHAAHELIKIGEWAGNKILTEEDKGVALATTVSLIRGLPLAVARWYPYHLPTEINIPISCEYYKGNLYVNGINPGDQVILVDDTISTGGTLISLIDAVRQRGADIAEVLVLVEKVDNRGVERVKTETGLDVKTVMKIQVEESGVIVLDK
ncbi:adenine phosphoribosyltransferase [Paenibacillus sp. FJAT-26967]|uniref:adenine phosphoribosyltransferase n=1 Tax=Paenibacillus sp. FJAT-26967 TaxID=1729690 RepID=UPI00083865E6|nr:adenine phosphoribosyltransferase [Paenibacillus sp. FJAT-26967]